MLKKSVLLALGASALLSLTCRSSGQVVFPNFPQDPRVPFPKLEGLPPEIQQQIEQILQRAALQQRRPIANESALKWGGVRLTQADVNMQQQLGLEEKEGLVITAVEPRSAADLAGLQVNDVLVKINDKSVPNDLDGFVKLLKDQKVNETAELVVVRRGKEETIKGAKLPLLVESPPAGRAVRPGNPDIANPRIPINPRLLPANILPPGPIDKLHLEMTINGAKIVRKQDRDQFTGEYSKDDLKITLAGKFERGVARPGEVSVTDGRETKKYASSREVPPQYRQIMQQLMPSSFNGLMLLSTFPELPGRVPAPGLEERR